jgi:hypothetical protein
MMKKLNKCIVCGKETKNPSWCSNECADVSDGNAPRRTGGFERDDDKDFLPDFGSRHSGHPGFD